MAEQSEAQLARLQAIMTELLKRRISDSLEQVECSLQQWRTRELGAFEAHAEVMRHAARTERLAGRMARVGFDSAGSLMRDAYDAGVIDEAEFHELMGCCPGEVDPSPPLDVGDEAAQELPAKKDVVEELLDDGAVLVHIDARATDVVVPERFRSDAKLVLRFGYNLSPAVPDLSIDETGLVGTLTFGGVPFRCELPWTAVYAVVSEVNSRGLVWPEDVPDDVIGELANGESGDGPHAGDEAQAATPLDGDDRKGCHLRLVK